MVSQVRLIDWLSCRTCQTRIQPNSGGYFPVRSRMQKRRHWCVRGWFGSSRLSPGNTMRFSLTLFFLLEPLTLCMGRLSTVAHARDFCTLPRDEGSCIESLRRFFFNATSWQCEPFIFRGCQGNLNRFITKEECEHSCGMIEKTGFCPPSPSGLAIECLAGCWHDGNCPDDQKCCSYGCSLRCTDPIKDLCRLPPESGPCDLSVRSWFYNWQAQACQPFTYGGCLGNKNRFQTCKACKRQCARPRASRRPHHPRSARVQQC